MQGATGTKQYSWTTRRTVDLGTGRVSHSLMVIPECPYPLLGRDLLTKMGAQICFHPEGAKILNKEGHLIQVLVLSLEDEYSLHQMPSAPMTDIDHWLREFSQAWAETGGIGLAQHQPAIYIELKLGADPVRVCQYPMPLISLTQTGTPPLHDCQEILAQVHRIRDLQDQPLPNVDTTWYMDGSIFVPSACVAGGGLQTPASSCQRN